MTKPRLKVKQYTTGTNLKHHTIWNVYGIDSKWHHGCSINSDTFTESRPTLEAYLDYLESIECDHTVNKWHDLLTQ